MKEKNKFKISDKKFNVFIPLVNLLLFESFNFPDFESGNENLSENFIEILKSVEGIDLNGNDFIRTRILYFLLGLNIKSREEIFEIIIENEMYTHAMSISYALENNRSMNSNSTPLSQETFFLELVEFKFNGVLNKVILVYFIFHFEDIFGFKFSDNKYITKNDYVNILENLCKEKDFLNKNFF